MCPYKRHAESYKTHRAEKANVFNDNVCEIQDIYRHRPQCVNKKCAESDGCIFSRFFCQWKT